MEQRGSHLRNSDSSNSSSSHVTANKSAPSTATNTTSSTSFSSMPATPSRTGNMASSLVVTGGPPGTPTATAVTTFSATATPSASSKKDGSHRLDKPLPKQARDIYLGTFALMFAEVVRYCYNRVSSIGELEDRLLEMGKRVGFRLVELTVLREKVPRRRIKIDDVLAFLQVNLWKTLFGKQADLLEFVPSEDGIAYWLSDQDILVNRYISVNKDYVDLNCATYVAGIVAAVTEGMGFPASVSAHSVEGKGTTLQLKFEKRS